jgi:hypothetical protein
MTATRLIEHRITRHLQRRRELRFRGLAAAPEHRDARQFDMQPWADRLIAILAVTTGLLVVGSYVEELLWAALAAATVYTLR